MSVEQGFCKAFQWLPYWKLPVLYPWYFPFLFSVLYFSVTLNIILTCCVNSCLCYIAFPPRPPECNSHEGRNFMCFVHCLACSRNSLYICLMNKRTSCWVIVKIEWEHLLNKNLMCPLVQDKYLENSSNYCTWSILLHIFEKWTKCIVLLYQNAMYGY